MNYENQSQRRSWFSSGRTVVLLLILTSIGVLLFTGHGAHLLGILPYLLLLACPFVHFFMHASHGKHELRHQYSMVTARPISQAMVNGIASK